MLAAVLTDSILRQQGAERTAWGNLIHSRLEKEKDHASQLQIYPPCDTTVRQHPSFSSPSSPPSLPLSLFSSEVLLFDWMWKINWILPLYFLPHWNLEYT